MSFPANELNQYTDRATPSWLPVSGQANRPGGAQIEVNGTVLPSTAWQHRYFYKAEPKGNPAAATLQSILLTATPGSGGAGETRTLHSMARPVAETSRRGQVDVC
jgi:hypothetical protein